jgi:hypothetical protein
MVKRRNGPNIVRPRRTFQERFMKTPDERHAQDSVLSEFNLSASMHFSEISALTL